MTAKEGALESSVVKSIEEEKNVAASCLLLFITAIKRFRFFRPPPTGTQ